MEQGPRPQGNRAAGNGDGGGGRGVGEEERCYPDEGSLGPPG